MAAIATHIHALLFRVPVTFFLPLILFHKTVVRRCAERSSFWSKLYHELFQRFAAANSPELAVKMLRGFLGIAFIVLFDDFNRPCFDREIHTWAIEHGKQLKRSSERKGRRTESPVSPSQPLVPSEDGAAQVIVNKDGDNDKERRCKRKTAAEIEKLENHRKPSGSQSEISVRVGQTAHDSHGCCVGPDIFLED
jgi:hypothetical protein